MEHLKETEWCCPQCGTLLGTERAGRLHFGDKQLHYVVVGTVMVFCFHCRKSSEVNIGHVPAAASGDDLRLPPY